MIPALLAAGLRPLRFRHAFAIEKAGAVDEKIGPRRRLTLLVRDPVKVMESFAYRMRSADRLRKPPRYPEARDMSLSEIVRSERHGVGRLIDYHRAFDAVRSDEHYVLYYEDMRADAVPIVEGLLRHAGHDRIDRAAVLQALESSSFDSMQAMERQYRIEVGLPLEAHAFRFRAAREETELSAEDAAYIQGGGYRHSGALLLTFKQVQGRPPARAWTSAMVVCRS